MSVVDELYAPIVKAAEELKPITTRALSRPSYVHHELLGVDRTSWVLANVEALTDWYSATGSVKHNDDEFMRFCLTQYDMETANREELKREWASLPRTRRT